MNLGPAILGFIFAIGGLCTIPGALVAQRVASRFGTGWAMLGGWTLAALAGFLVPLAAGPTMVVITVLAVARAVDGAADVIANIHQWTLRQAVIPVGGMLGSIVGLRQALLICAIGMLLAPLWAIFSPVRNLREQPTHPKE